MTTPRSNPPPASSETKAAEDGDPDAPGELRSEEHDGLSAAATGVQQRPKRALESMPAPVRPPSSRPPPASETLYGGRIRIVDQVGRGAMSQVLRGVDTRLGRELALKIAPLPRDQMPRPLLVRFLEEAQVTAQLEHPNVVPVHDLGVDPDGHVYFSMKLIRGQSLETIIEKRKEGDAKTLAKFGLRRLLDVFLQVCQAIEYAHARGVIHRDLKPANIMVGDFGEVLVMDWGVAKLKGRTDHAMSAVSTSADAAASVPPPPTNAATPEVTSLRAGKKAWETQLGVVIGTPAYMSPEQAEGKAVDERTDVYALGVILYEILCGEVPFDEEDPQETLRRVRTEAPRRPSLINHATPLALEALALRLLEKDPTRRSLTLSDIRAHVQNYIEGIGRDYGQESLWSSLVWTVGALVVFAFLVWYLTGQSVAQVLALGPPAVLNAVGWFLLVMALGYPLWAVPLSLQQRRAEHDRFRPANRDEVFISGYLSHRTLAAAVAPLFQLVFIVQLVSFAIAQAVVGGSAGSTALVQRISTQLRVEWSESLIIILVLLFTYLYLLSTEVRFARRIDRYELLIRRPAWETMWPFFLIIVLLLTVATTGAVEWALTSSGGNAIAFVREQVLSRPLNLVDIGKTLVFQGTFLLGLTVVTMLLSFPFAELLASLRIAYQPADEAAVTSRALYFLRSLAAFRVARATWLYGGAMIGVLTAITILTQGAAKPLVEKVLYILGPWLIGFMGYSVVARSVRGYLANAPAVQRMLDQRFADAREEQHRVNLAELEQAPWRWRLVQLSVPVVCLLAYLLWTGSGIHQEAIRNLIVPMTAKDWLFILPYALLVPVLLARDHVQQRRLRRRLAEKTA